ncbi:MAG: hypothetical protein ACKOXB_10205 [Flavobacteriales bacterium]
MGYKPEIITTAEQYQAIKLYVQQAEEKGINNNNIQALKAYLLDYEIKLK